MSAVTVYEDVYDMVENKRNEIHKKYGRRLQQREVASAAIMAGIDKVEEKLGFIKHINEVNK